MEKVQNVLEQVKTQFLEVLGDNLVGIYVHGSIAFQCFNWENSDIDFIAVVRRKIDRQTKLALLRILDLLWEKAPPKGFEMSVALMEYCKEFRYPTPYELHFSSSWIDRYRKDPLLLCGDEIKTDPDLAAHFTVIRKVGIVLYGSPVSEVFGEVRKEYYIDSIKKDIADAEQDILTCPMYIVLNLCRVLAYLRGGLVLSKKQGGEWGLSNLDERFHELIKRAVGCYTSGQSMTINEREGKDFSNYMLTEIGNDSE